LVLIDEAYYPFYPKTVLPWINDYPHLIVTRSTGKAWGLAGFRLGYAVANSNVTQVLHKVRSMYETNTLAVAVMERMLDHEKEMLVSVRRLEEGKKKFLDAMQGLRFHVLETYGNFLHVAFENYAEKIHVALSKLVYYRQDFNHPCLRGFSRFSTTTSELFKPVIERIRQVVEEK
ncbi:MAG: aminotransferase class I/II-fold pyridoxal phosphate-dependent enzyme, partial [Deltaproteobacteria bacterium]|nr:aminotransferase class I/II-fold pyridoxal phosphate-dependent enzyme [Deltaproteobacteria bacterium]